jgi:dolichyl-phosphate beta-glucosyltransferase
MRNEMPARIYTFLLFLTSHFSFHTYLHFAAKNLLLAFYPMNTTISIVIPAFEEQARLGDSLGKILSYIKENTLDAELIVVDDGSGDKTAEIARGSCAEFPEIKTDVIRYEKNRGKGYAVKMGLLASSGDIALFSDADVYTD